MILVKTCPWNSPKAGPVLAEPEVHSSTNSNWSIKLWGYICLTPLAGKTFEFKLKAIKFYSSWKNILIWYHENNVKLKHLIMVPPYDLFILGNKANNSTTIVNIYHWCTPISTILLPWGLSINDVGNQEGGGVKNWSKLGTDCTK